MLSVIPQEDSARIPPLTREEWQSYCPILSAISAESSPLLALPGRLGATPIPGIVAADARMPCLAWIFAFQRFESVLVIRRFVLLRPWYSGGIRRALLNCAKHFVARSIPIHSAA